MTKTERFINRATLVHGTKYDYTNTIFVRSSEKVSITCNTCNTTFQQLPHNHLAGSGCRDCQYKLLPQNQARTKDNFIELAKKIHGNTFEYLSEYKTKRDNITIKCTICQTVFQQRADSHMGGCGCKICQYRNLPQNKPKISISEFEIMMHIIHNNKYVYHQDYKGMRNFVKITCPLHGDFTQVAYAHRRTQGCPDCKISKGEIYIAKWLSEYKIGFEQQKRFPGCKRKFELPFDFYLPDLNLCIEFDGEQHYKPVKLWGGLEGLRKIQESDQIKKQYCIDNDIRLLRIRFDNKDIANILKHNIYDTKDYL